MQVRHWVKTRGVVLPAPVAGHPALELPNTWAGWTAAGVPHGSPESHDYLKSWRHLVVLGLDRGLLPAEWESWLLDLGESEPERVDRELVKARELRSAAYRALTGRATDADLEVVSRLATQARGHQTLVARDELVAWELAASAGRRAPVLALASSIADLLTSRLVERVNACPGEGCGWLFVNASGRRRWCQMGVCGNRAKARAFVARHHEGRPGPAR